MRLGAGNLLLLRVVLDPIETEDQIDRPLRDRRRRQRLVEIASQVRVAGGSLATRHLRDDVVAAVPVDDRRALGAGQEPLRRLAAATTSEDVGDVLIAVLVSGDEGPDEAVLRLTGTVVLHQEACLVGADDRPRPNLVEESLPQGLSQLARSMQEVVHRRASQREAATREVFLEAVEGQVVRTLCDRQVCEQARAVPPLLDHLGGRPGP
jgi:hypothetical protein